MTVSLCMCAATSVLICIQIPVELLSLSVLIALPSLPHNQGLICNSGRWWNCSADFSSKKNSANLVELSGTASRLANWMRCRNSIHLELTRRPTYTVWPNFLRPLPAIIIGQGRDRRLEAGNGLNRSFSHCLQQLNKNVVELSGTGVPPSLLDEVQERRSGAYRGGGTALRLVPAEIKHCTQPFALLLALGLHLFSRTPTPLPILQPIIQSECHVTSSV